jgi:hypothetical protein
MFGYITATLASYFVGSDSSQSGLQQQIDRMRREVEALSNRLP